MCEELVSSGEMSDFQEIVRVMQEYNISDQIQGDMIEFMTPMDYANILCTYYIIYSARP